MGYTHYWYTAPTLDPWEAFTVDVQKIVTASRELGLKLAGPMGSGEPVIGPEFIALNGSETCGHTKDESIVIPWPSRTATGIASGDEDAKVGMWFAGTTLEARQCNGDCSYETFRIDRTWTEVPRWQSSHDGKKFDCCKTAYRPYDVTVTAILLAAKHHFSDAIDVSSDGEEKDWQDGRMLCEVACGYGRDVAWEEVS